MDYDLPIEQVVNTLDSNVERGLTETQVNERKQQFGPNALKEKKKKSLVSKFFDQFKDVMIIILIIAAIISFAIACYGHDPLEFFEPALILGIVVINAIMGVIQENKAEKALDALKSLSAPHTKVIRDGVSQIINASDLVPGDVILLEAGDFVPADARLIRSSSLKVEESALTGESLPSEKDADAQVKKNAPIGDRTNMIFSGCSVTYGSAVAIVTNTGMQTEMGKIANLLNDESDSSTPLQRKLTSLGKILGIVALAACLIIFIIGLISKTMDFMDVFMVSVSLAVSAIPEGLPVVVTIVLSIGVTRMAKKNALIRRLPAVETLGSASVICSDKTGTLTQNRMTLTKVYCDGQDVELISNDNSDKAKLLLSYGTLCSDGSVVINDQEEKHIGDPTETAIVYASYKNGNTKDQLNEKYPRIACLPFDSERKLMSTVNIINGKKVVIVKGAFDVMASRCIKGDIEKAKEITNAMSSDALRVLAVAYKEIDELSEKPTPEQLEKDLIFMGLVGMIDPPRPEVKDSVEVCKRAGIKPVMITGDHIATASAIARELGILGDGDLAITGAELDEYSDDKLNDLIEKISVYARVSPENKIRIVKAWQRKGQVVAMTGDGVNDAPALKAADIGCAMGITGTDVAKSASDMTLTDDNFATIVDAVKEGRGIYANLKKVVNFLLGTNISEVIAVFFSMLVWNVSPFLSMQLLWINLVGDSLPAIALGMEPVEKDVMTHLPKPKKEGLFANGLGLRIFLQGLMFTILSLIGFVIVWYEMGKTEQALPYARTMAFMVLALSQAIHAYNLRSHLSLIKMNPFSNKNLNIATIVAFLLMGFVLFVPGVNTAFGLVILDVKYYLIALGLIFVPVIVIELAKLFKLIKE